ncbi:MAG: oligosaccharide flippase family protein [Actinomycetota bacterium]|nr:oligosaccharide flippase family protein [Actinomycetota bacterium]
MASLTSRELQDRALSGSLWTLVNVAVTLPLSIVANALTARLLGPEEYGKLAFLLALLGAAIPLSEVGFGQALVQWGVGAEMSGDSATTDRLLRTRTGFALVIQLPLLWAGGLVVLAGEALSVRIVFLAATLVLAGGASAQAALLIQNRTAALAKIAMLVGICVQVGIVITAITTDDAGSVWSARVAIASLGPLVAAVLISRRFLRVTLRPLLPRGLPSGFWRFALLSWVAGASALLVYSRSEVFVLRMYDQATELGLFAVAFGLSLQLTLPLDSLLAPLFPAKAALASAHIEHVHQALLRSLRFFAVLAGALLSLLPALYFVTPLVFGEPFRRSADLLLVLGIASTFQSVTSPFTLLAFARRRGATLARAFVVALVVDLSLAVILVGPYGAWGAVVANVAGQLTSIVILTRLELAAQGATVKEVALAIRPWAMAVLGLVPTFLVSWTLRFAVSPLVATGAAAVTGPLMFALLVRLTGGGLTGADSRALLGLLPDRLGPLARVVLRPAIMGGRHADRQGSGASGGDSEGQSSSA